MYTPLAGPSSPLDTGLLTLRLDFIAEMLYLSVRINFVLIVGMNYISLLSCMNSGNSA